jgi:hypothetical protein
MLNRSNHRRETTMLRKSHLLAPVLAVAAIGATVTAVAAMPVSSSIAPPSLAESVRLCPSGPRPVFEGKYCWRKNETDPCPRGYHLCDMGKYCWRNH